MKTTKQSPRPVALLAIAVLTLTALSAEAWNLEPCDPSQNEAWDQFAHRLKTAEPDSNRYIPHPFPANAQEVIADFVYQHRRAWSDTEHDELPATEQRFFALLDRDALRFEVLRVENWTPLRCGPHRERPFFHVVRAYDRESGVEITRAALNRDGLISTLIHRPTDEKLAHYPPDMVNAAEAGRKIASRLGGSINGSQLVAAFGTIHCHVLAPCAAVRRGARVYLYDATRPQPILELELSEPRLSVSSDLGEPGARRQVLELASKGGQGLVTLGGDAAVLARPIE